jgi:hypothetical protein
LKTQEQVNSFLTATDPTGRVEPVYTHLIKELTDEEILEIITKVSEEQGLVWLGDKVIFPFARAILKKAQEK